MKIIKDLTVKVTYRVSLDNVEVPDEVYDALSECYDDGVDISPNSMTDEDEIAANWLDDNIKESDSTDWEYEIEEFQD